MLTLTASWLAKSTQGEMMCVHLLADSTSHRCSCALIMTQTLTASWLAKSTQGEMMCVHLLPDAAALDYVQTLTASRHDK
jgi:hypothetical protein